MPIPAGTDMTAPFNESPGDAGDRYEWRLALVGADVEEILDLPQLPVASYEWSLEHPPT